MSHSSAPPPRQASALPPPHLGASSPTPSPPLPLHPHLPAPSPRPLSSPPRSLDDLPSASRCTSLRSPTTPLATLLQVLRSYLLVVRANVSRVFGWISPARRGGYGRPGDPTC